MLKSMMIYRNMTWDDVYSSGNIPWDTPYPDQQLLKLIEEYKIHPCNVLDIGCGRGLTSRELAKRSFVVKGIDISSKAIELAKSESKNLTNNLTFEVVDFMQPKFLGDTFDFVIDTACFHYNLNNNFVERVFNHLNQNGLWYTSIGSVEDKQNFLISSESKVEGSPELSLEPPAYSLDKIVNILNPYFIIQDIMHYKWGGDGFYFYSVLMTKRS